jgi:site-specific recombinase
MKNRVENKQGSKQLNILAVSGSCSWKCVIFEFLFQIILLGVFYISVATGFALAIGLCVGSLGQKIGWWENNYR